MSIHIDHVPILPCPESFLEAVDFRAVECELGGTGLDVILYVHPHLGHPLLTLIEIMFFMLALPSTNPLILKSFPSTN